jgi:hypothetical protein
VPTGLTDAHIALESLPPFFRNECVNRLQPQLAASIGSIEFIGKVLHRILHKTVTRHGITALAVD